MKARRQRNSKVWKENSLKYDQRIGNKLEVGQGKAFQTSGGLVKKDLLKKGPRKYVSKRKSQLAKKLQAQGKLNKFT